MTPDATWAAWTTNRIELYEIATGAHEAGPDGFQVSLSDDASRYTFLSLASLSRRDTNSFVDVYVGGR